MLISVAQYWNIMKIRRQISVPARTRMMRGVLLWFIRDVLMVINASNVIKTPGTRCSHKLARGHVALTRQPGTDNYLQAILLQPQLQRRQVPQLAALQSCMVILGGCQQFFYIGRIIEAALLRGVR